MKMATPTPKTVKRIVKFNNFWRETKVAIKSELYDRYWELEMPMQAWLIAALETQEVLDYVMAEYGQPDED
jgi:hypothetical protein